MKRFFLALFFSLLTLSIFAANSNRTVKVGCFPLNGFYDFADDDCKSGYGFEYTDELAKYASWNVEYVVFTSWVEALNALSNNKIDILAPAQNTKDRKEQFYFDSFPIGTEYGALVALSTTDNLIYEDFKNFNGLKVGCVKSLVFLNSFLEYQKANNFNVELNYYKDTPALIAALNVGEVDAALVNMMVKTGSMKLLSRFSASPIYFMVNKERPEIFSEMNKAVNAMNSSRPEFQSELSEKYFYDFGNIPFTKDEINFIKTSPLIRVACGGTYAPFSYTAKDGNIVGVDKSVLDAVSKISGLRFECVNASDKNILSQKNVLLTAGLENDSRHQSSSDVYTNPYLEVTKYFVGLANASYSVNTKFKIAVVNASPARLELWKERFPSVDFVSMKSLSECLKSLRSGTVNAILENRYSLEKVLASPKNSDLKFFPYDGIITQICFKLSSKESTDTQKILASIINKSIRQIPKSDIDRFISENVRATAYQYGISDFIYQYRFVLLAILFLLSTIFVIEYLMIRSKRKARLAIEENEMKLRHITNNIKGGVIVLKENEGLRITFANDGFLQMISISREQFNNTADGSYLAYVHPEDLAKVQEAVLSDKKELSIELRILKSDGSYVPALFNCAEGQKTNGEKELYCVILDMTEQNKLLEQLRIENRRTELILDRVEEIFFEVNLSEKNITTSSSFESTLGWNLPEKIENITPEFFASMWNTNTTDLEKLRAVTKEMLSTKQPASVVVQLESKVENKYIWVEILQHPILSADNSIVSVIGLIKNIDSQVKEREALFRQTQVDPLTGLYNKEAFEKIVSQDLQKLPNQNHALIFIDLDNFKNVNDTLGHLAGDKAICEAADKLKVVFSNYDVISRFGGDEFCIFVKNISPETLRGKMGFVVEKLHTEYVGERGTVTVTCSCGVSVTEKQGFDYKKLMRSADEALYHSKETGRNRFTFFMDGLQSAQE